MAAFSDEVERAPLKQTILGKSVVLNRLQDGPPVASDDGSARPSYPLIERGPLIWIWMGDAAVSDPALLPEQDWITSPEWACSRGSFHLPSQYVSLHDNLFDLTHLSNVYAQSFDAPDYATAPFETEVEQGRILIRHSAVHAPLPSIWAEPMRLVGVGSAGRIAESEFKSPGFHEIRLTFYDSALPARARRVSRVRTAHLVTPETGASTHYFIVQGRDFGLEDPSITAFMNYRLFAAVEEEVAALSVPEIVLERPDKDVFEVSVSSDAAALAMRRALKERADQECAGLTPASAVASAY